jgi:hypothetical protein
MTAVALGSMKQAPGVTTTALAIAAVWPAHRRVLVAEVDPSGGDLAARYDLPVDRGLASLTAARDRHPGSAWAHVQELPGGLPVLAGPASEAETEMALRVVGSRLRSLVGASADLIADCGRLHAHSAALPVAESSDLLLIVARPQRCELVHVAARLPALRSMTRSIALVLTGGGPYPAAEVAEALGVEVLGELPHDELGAEFLSGRRPLRSVSRLPLFRAARALVRRLELGEEPLAPVADPVQCIATLESLPCR